MNANEKKAESSPAVMPETTPPGPEPSGNLRDPIGPSVSSTPTVDAVGTVPWTAVPSGQTFGEQGQDAATPWPQIAGYEIVGELGRGGMGVVYKARQGGLNRWVAIKMILAGGHLDPRQLMRFRVEAEAVARLQHPNVVQIYELGEHAGLPFFSLEFVDGGSLHQKIHGNPESPRQAAYLMETLARAVAFAHRQGIVHRDLKPANVLLTSGGMPKIADFGLAKRLEEDSGQTRTGTLVGTPNYMAPEQAEGDVHAIGPPADIYALGAILYELLTGRPPFQAATTMDTLVKVKGEEALAPSRLRPGLPKDLETICLKCLQKEPERRYLSADDLADDLGRFLAGEPIHARPINAAERIWRWCKRNPRLAGLSGVALGLLVAWALSSTWLYYQIRQREAATQLEYRRAEANRAQAEENARREKMARDQAERAEKKADERAKVAEKQRTIMLGSLYGMITKTEDMLRDKEGTSELRQALLATGMDGLRQVEQAFGNSTLVDRSMGVAYQRLGDIYESAGKTEETIRLYRQSVTVFERLQKEEPDNDWLPWNIAVSYDKLGGVSHEFQGDAATALDYYRKSLALREQLASRVNTPAINAGMRNQGLSVSYIKLATLTREVGDPATSLGYARKALALGEDNLSKNPSDRRAAAFKAMAYYVVGEAEVHLGKLDEGRSSLDQCQALREKLARDDPTSATAKRDLGTVYEAIGDLDMWQGHLASARQWFAKAHELYVALVKNEPDSLEDRWYLGHSHYRLGTIAELLGEKSAAAKEFSACLALREAWLKADPRNIQAQAEVALARAHCGRHAEATQAAEELSRRLAKDPDYQFTAGCIYALCATAPATDQVSKNRYLQAANDCLQRAVATGYRCREVLVHDPDLKAVRDTKAYQNLLAGLTK